MDEEQKKDDKAFSKDCTALIAAVSDALYAIGGKWKLMIIICIARGNKRFTEIQRQVTGISARVLSNELKDLELTGFIVKKVSVGYPVLIEYELTPYSNSLEKVVSSLAEWGVEHKQKIREDRPFSGLNG